MAVTNSGQKPTNALLTLHYDNGEKSYEMQQAIQPGDQMWVNVASLLRNRVPDRKGKVLPVDVTSGTFDLRDLTPAGDGLLESTLALDTTMGYQATQPCVDCCGYEADSISFDPYPVDVVIDGIDQTSIQALNACSDDTSNITEYFVTWGSYNPSVAAVTAKQVQGMATGTTTGTATGTIPTPGTCVCTNYKSTPTVPVSVGIPLYENTALYGTYLITEGSFVMTLYPANSDYDGYTVTESDYATGTDTCYWPGANLANPPSVVGSTWIVGKNGSGHNQYGVDSIGFNSVAVNYIQVNAAQHDVDFPCVVTFYQEMDYDTFFPYAFNVDTQTIGSNTVKVCRAGVCTGTIPW